MFKTIGAALAGAHAARARQPVRRHSRLAGQCEAVFWRRTDRREVRRVLLAARKYELAGRQPGRRNGPLGHVALEVLEFLVNLVDYRTGRLEPSLDTLTRKLRRSKDAVVRALAALRAHGFADWIRRFETVERDGPGPRIRQTSNAYRLSLPARAARLLGIQGQDVPLPDDLTHDRESQRQELAAMKAALSLNDLAVLEVNDRLLGRALAELGCSVQERESASRSESRSRVSS
ncbi:helix-turn-helix domain-containing protein [Rubellimicrobium rubrum]|uniref:Helix-turn-helix domain-containing protein n=1 Tax=Rubellimicrobium rubrum TaxID=2585369 RepID=A0A5C4MN14_9RHOB|nr:helix-turn-helix domain-containing protein [Rubellimicrobium rubrum]TNC44700.1 helix-turn-helix domain-containing protein [Rubellimicrobium rubrum]